MTDEDTVIEASGLHRWYGPPGGKGFEAVRGLNLTVARGELFALLGTNGAGKTSTVELLEGMAEPSAGRVRVLGHDPLRERARVRPRIGIMLQEGGFPAELTVRETARMWAGCVTGARPVAEALELVGLSGRRDVRVKQLSGGERRRLDLALALLGRPELLFLDEPTSGMDPEGRRATWQLVRSLQADGTTVLLTTHYLEEAEELADRLAIMRDGRIVISGTPAEVTAVRPSRIRCTLPPGTAPSNLPPIAGVSSVSAAAVGSGPGQPVEIRTEQLQETLTELLLWAREQGVQLAGLDARSASLEEAFLAVAGAPSGADGADGAADDATDGAADGAAEEVSRV